ncbi:MAG: hypothetical protein S0880_29285 [Actinomycetota bacterium]|nr:hypothetical protein [Actinomycetota bacterium]
MPQPQHARQPRTSPSSAGRETASALEDAAWRLATGRAGAVVGTRAVLAADPRHVRAHALVGAARWLDGDLVGAVESLSLAARTAARVPRRRDRQLVEVVCAVAGGTADRAGLVAREHAADFPDDIVVCLLLGRAAEIEGDDRVWSTVEGLLRAAAPYVAASSSPRLVGAHAGLAALAAAGRGRPDAASLALAALELDPGSGTAMHALVHALESRGEADVAHGVAARWTAEHHPAPWLRDHLTTHGVVAAAG